MVGESVETTGFNFFPTVEQYIDRPTLDGEAMSRENQADIQEWVSYLHPYLNPGNVRFSSYGEFPKHVTDTYVEGEGVSWLGNPLIVCTGGIQRSALTRKFLSGYVEGDNTIINNDLPRTATGGLRTLELTMLLEQGKVQIKDNKLFFVETGTSIDTIIFHLSQPNPDFDPEYDISTNASIGNLVKMLNGLLPNGGELDTQILFVVGDEKDVAGLYEKEYGIKPDKVF